jgi:hypothetical protein
MYGRGVFDFEQINITQNGDFVKPRKAIFMPNISENKIALLSDFFNPYFPRNARRLLYFSRSSLLVVRTRASLDASVASR